MHKFQLTWLLPFLMPFVFVFFIHAICQFAEVPDDEINNSMIASISFMFGVGSGIVFIIIAIEAGVDTSFRALFPKDKNNE